MTRAGYLVVNGMAETLGPNTNAAPLLLHKHVILSCGEDTRDVLAAFAHHAKFSAYHEHRCYKFWKFAAFTVIWTGFGTSCLEPLLWEILRPGLVDKIVLVGTAGNLPHAKTALGKVYVIRDAYLALTALDFLRIEQPLAPVFADLKAYEAASIVSTDLFYGFSPLAQTGAYPIDPGSASHLIGEHFAQRDMVDMEVGQFYYFCRAFTRNRPIEYVAFKGPSNQIGNAAEQNANSQAVTKSAFDAAVELLKR
jgi:hypothetical protein